MANINDQLARVLGKDPAEIGTLRKTDDIPPRICVVDVVAAITSLKLKDARVYFKRLMQSYPDISAKCVDFKFPGRGQGKMPVTDAQGIVEIVMVLQGRYAARVRQEAAKIFVRYLGGDLALVEEVYQNRKFQERISANNPNDPRRVFGEAVESAATQTASGSVPPVSLEGVLAIADAIKAPILEAVRDEIQRTRPWDFHKHAKRNNPLVDVGVILEGDALAKLDDDEHVIRITDFLKEQVAPESWRRHGNKFKNIFAIELKKQKTQMCEDHEQPLYIARVQGEYRIVYTEADDELMANVFRNCKRRFQGIATRDEALLKSRRKQRRIEDYFLADDDGMENYEEREIDDMHTERPSASTGTASSSLAGADSATSSDSIALHREAVAEAPAEIRLRAKRGDANIHIADP